MRGPRFRYFTCIYFWKKKSFKATNSQLNLEIEQMTANAKFFYLLDIKFDVYPILIPLMNSQLIGFFYFSWNVTVWRRWHEWNGLISRQILIRYIFTQEIGPDQELESDCWIFSIVSTIIWLTVDSFHSKKKINSFPEHDIRHTRTARQVYWCFCWRNAIAFQRNTSVTWHWWDWVQLQRSSTIKW